MELVKYLWVVIRFQVCIFDILNTARSITGSSTATL